MSAVSLTTLLAVWFVANPDMDSIKVDSKARPSTAEPAVQRPQHWLTSYARARSMAARHKLPLLLHFDAPWCGACRQMEQSVLNQPSVTKLLGSKVIGVRLNADLNKELIAEFGISSLPTEVVVLADGSRGSRFTGATSLNSYVSRLNDISGSNSAAVAKSDATETQSPETQNLRSCLIVTRDGKMVGLGGFSPVALKTGRKWKRGSEQFVATHEGVEYYLSSVDEVSRFNSNPAHFIPHFHGCDLVELSQENRALTGAIEYGAFYNNKVFFFASLENRDRFEKNPRWYLAAATNGSIENENGYPFVNN